MNNTIGGHDVLLRHDFDAVDSDVISIAPDLNAAPFLGLVQGSDHDRFSTLHAVQQVVLRQR